MLHELYNNLYIHPTMPASQFLQTNKFNETAKDLLWKHSPLKKKTKKIKAKVYQAFNFFGMRKEVLRPRKTKPWWFLKDDHQKGFLK